jgi:phosphatidylglycerophosphatase C
MRDPAANPNSTDTLAAFDFDGTLTTHDSFMRFLAWRRPPALFAADLILTAPILALYAARIVPNERHKMSLFARQFAGTPVGLYQSQAHEFALSKVPNLIRPEAMRRLRFHQEQGHQVVIVTASLTDWISPWAKSVGVNTVLGSAAQAANGRLTGRLEGANCHGPEKLRRLMTICPQRSLYTLFAYGDSRGDKELLSAADKPYFRRFE